MRLDGSGRFLTRCVVIFCAAVLCIFVATSLNRQKCPECSAESLSAPPAGASSDGGKCTHTAGGERTEPENRRDADETPSDVVPDEERLGASEANAGENVLPLRTRSFEGSHSFSRVRILIADSPDNTGRSPTDCFAVTASSLFPLSFDYVAGNDAASHVTDWFRAAYCNDSVRSRLVLPQFVLVVSACTTVGPLSEFVGAVASSAAAILAKGSPAMGLIRLDASAPREVAPSIHTTAPVLIDAHKYLHYGCPDLGPFRTSSTEKALGRPFPRFVAASTVRGIASLRRELVTLGPERWYVSAGQASFMVGFIAEALFRDDVVLGLSGALAACVGAGDSRKNGDVVLCDASPLCTRVRGSGSIDGAFAALVSERHDRRMPYTAVRFAAETGCFDVADIGGCALRANEAPLFVGTNEPPRSIANVVEWTATHVVPHLARGRIHFMSVVGGMTGLNVLAQLPATSTAAATFFDYGRSQQLCVARVYIELLKSASARSDFVTSMFARDLAQFVREDPEAALTHTSQSRYLARRVDDAIVARTASALTPFAAVCYRSFFEPLLRNPQQHLAFTPVYAHNSWARGASGNVTVHFGTEGSFLASDEAMASIKKALRSARIGFADYDLNHFGALLRHSTSQRAENVVVYISNADDKHFSYLPNFERVLSDAVVLLRHVERPARAFVVSTNGVYALSRDGWSPVCGNFAPRQ